MLLNTHLMVIVLQICPWGQFYDHGKGNMNTPKPITEVFRQPYQHLSQKNARTQQTYNSTRYTWGEMMTTKPRGFRRYASSCQPILNDTQRFGVTWRTVISWVQTNIQRLQLPPIMYFAITKIRRHNAKHIHHPGWWRLSRATIQTAARKSQ